MRIKHRLLLTHGLLVMLALCIIIINIMVYWDMESDSRIVNHAGKLRALVYNMVQITNFHEYVDEQATSKLLSKRMEEFELVMKDLADRNGVLNTRITQKDSIERLDRIKEEWEEIFRPTFQKVISGELPLTSLEKFNDSIEIYATEIDDMVMMYSLYTREKINRAFLINGILFLLIISLAGFSYVTTNNHIRRPMQLLMKELKDLSLFDDDPTLRLNDLQANEFSEMTDYFNVMIYDYLTKAFNRRSGLAKLNRMLQHEHRRHLVISLCFIDINGLKTVNDVLGHRYGDELIVTAVEIIREEIREEDFIIRMGGDEFLIVFTGIGIETAEHVWSRIRESFERINAEEQREYLISASHGMVEYDNIEKPKTEILIKLADEKMYDEKRMIKETSTFNVIRE